MLLQAYDFLHLFDTYGCRLQLGGSDQWGNITMGIDLVRKVRQDEVWGLTTPLVVKADGTKFGKTESGTVWLDAERTSPYQLYQFFLRSEDAVVGTYLRYFTFLDHEAILALDEATANHPERREAHRELARQVCTLVHGSHRDGAGRAGGRRPVQRGRHPPGRAVDPRGVRRRPVHHGCPGPGWTATGPPGRPVGGDGAGPLPGPGPDHHRAGRRLPQQPEGRGRGGARSGPTTWWPGGTWSSAAGSVTTTWCASTDDSGRPNGRPDPAVLH